MEAPAVSVSLGVVQSLPAKLKRLLSPEADHGLHNKDKDKIRLLKDHLQELIDKYLMEPSEVEAPASTARCWVKEVRELSYDIDDFLDELIHGRHADLKNLRRRSRWVADKVSLFRARLKDAIQRHRAYNLDRCKKRPGSLASEERPHPPQYGLATARLVGIDSSMEKLGEWLTGDAERTLRVVSIVGLGGVGKTTLARELYRKIGSQFECRAFARTSQKPDMRDLLSSILLQIRPERPPDASESCNLIDTIRTHLQHKKYFIIIDDLWAPSTWDVVCLALPDDECCSRVLTTTEIDVVAQTCCGRNSEYILKMGPLRDDESKELFFNRFPGDQSDSFQQSEVLSEIVRKCGGFPLATVTISSLLARQQSGTEQCNSIRRSLSSNLRTNPSMEGMKQVLDLCYNNLPVRLKACMLYFSTYKEEHIIWKDDLVKQWIAEGFICAKEGNSMEEVASTYLDELVIAGMVQPVDVNHNGVLLSCTVHYMILNLVRYKSIEENFVTAIDGSQSKIRLADKVRRLSLLFGNADDAEPPANLRLSQVRSLFFYGFFKSFPSIVEFRYLRVLILHLWGDQDSINFDLTALCKLFGLKYLEIVCNVTLSLQIEMQGLRHLETLKIDSRVSEVPQDIVHLPGLLHLSVPGDTNLPNGIGRLATLQTLRCFDLTRNSADNVLSLGALTNLWDLRLTCSESQPGNLKKNMEHVVSALSKLRNLKTLTLLSAGSNNKNTLEASVSSNDISYDLSSVSSPSTLLETLELMPRICILSVLPEWIGKLLLLSILKIEVMGVSGRDIEILQELPALAALSLYVLTAPAERIVFHREGFPVLMQFVFICSALCVAFEEGAMPNVRRLMVGFNANTTGKYSIADAGLKNLTIVEVFSAKIGGAGADEFCRKVVQSALEEIFRQNMRPPIIDIQFVGWAFYGDKENSTASATQQIAVEEPFEDIVCLFQDPAFSCDDKGISATSTAHEVVEEGSTENNVSHLRLRDPAFSYSDKEISTMSTTKQIENKALAEYFINHLQDLDFSFGNKEISTALATHQIGEEGSTEDFVPQLRDRAFSYGHKEISKLSATQRTGEEGSTQARGPLDVVIVYAFDCSDWTSAWYTVDGVFWMVQEKLTHFVDSCLGYIYVMLTSNTYTCDMKPVDSGEAKATGYTGFARRRTTCKKDMASGLAEAHKMIGYRGSYQNGIILFFSDGLINKGDFFDGTENFTSKVPVHTFTLGGDANKQCLLEIAANSPGGKFHTAPVPDRPDLSPTFSRLLDSILGGTTMVDDAKPPKPSSSARGPLDVVIVYAFDCTDNSLAWYTVDGVFWLVQEKLTQYADSCLGYIYVMSTPNTYTCDMKPVDSAETKATGYKAFARRRMPCTKYMASGLVEAHKMIGSRGSYQNGIILFFSDGLINTGDFFDGTESFISKVPVHTFTLGGDAYNHGLQAIAANSPGGTFNPVPIPEIPQLSAPFSKLLDGLLRGAMRD